MSRRRFLQMTVAIAAAAALPTLSDQARAGEAALPAAELDAYWIPTVAEVAEWLEYYKLTVGTAVRRFADIVLGLDAGSDEPGALEREFAQAEADFNRLGGARLEVAWQWGRGYNAGRNGEPRANPRFQVPSHQGFAWYNYWAVGDYDRRRDLGLPRLGRTLEMEYQIQRERDAANRLLYP